MTQWGVVILAGGLVKDPLACRIGTPQKALAEFNGLTSIERTVQAVRDSGISLVVVVGCEYDGQISGNLPDLGTAAKNAIAGTRKLEELGASKVLLLPADQPLMFGSAIRQFIDHLDSRTILGEFFASGLAKLSDFRNAYPSASATPIRLRDGEFLSGGLFAGTLQAIYSSEELVAEFRKNRKSQIKMVARVGLDVLLRFVFRRVTLAEAESRLERLMRHQCILVPDCHPSTVLDFDNVDEYEEISAIFNQMVNASSRST